MSGAIRVVGCCVLSLLLLAACAPMHPKSQPSEPQAQQNAPQKPSQLAAEQEIFSQAVLTGAAVGAGVGALLGAIIDKNSPGTGALIGGVAGAAVGSAAGAAVAKKQIQDYRDIRLKNDQLETLLQKAKEYNATVEQQNASMEQELMGLKKYKKAQRKTIASSKMQDLQTQQQNLQKAIAERKQLSETLVAEQKQKYQETLGDLEKQEKYVDSMMNQAKVISETGYVGPLT